MFMTPAPFDFGLGYNETINHRIEWLSGTEVKLTDNYDGERVVDIELRRQNAAFTNYGRARVARARPSRVKTVKSR